jgi:hypothetical protein
VFVKQIYTLCSRYVELHKYVACILSFMVKRHFSDQLNSKTKSVIPLLTLAVIVAGTTIVPLQSIYAQTTPAKNITATTPNATTDTVSKNVIAALAKPGFGNKYDLLVNGKPVPISYNIIGGSLVGMLADPSRHSVNVAVNPGPSGGALEIQLPRQTVDAKSGTNNDDPFVVVMDGSRISGDQSGICVTASIGPGNACANVQGTFKESQNTGTDRVLTILFGPDSRFIEIHGNTGMA